MAMSRKSPMTSRVTPLAGVWIEIRSPVSGRALVLVTPLAGVWIEISSWLRLLLW